MARIEKEKKPRHPLTDEQRRANNNASKARYKAANRERYLETMRQIARRNNYAGQLKYYYAQKEKRVNED
jgi:hypothetical protein